MEYHCFTLSNGLRVVHRETASPVSHCGLIINAGSRDENESEQGMAHFIEHVLFKGTKRRKAYHILSRLEDVGGELNAYTGKEETVLYASFLKPHMRRAVDLLFDIAFNSTYPNKEIAKEKDVINDEIHSYLDSPGESIFDDFDEIVFADHPIGRNILGTTESLKGINREKIGDWMARHYTIDRMVFSSAGPFTAAYMRRVLESIADQIPARALRHNRRPINGYLPMEKIVDKETYQTHTLLGARAYDMHHINLTHLTLLNNILGGPGMNSRLNLNIRERYGFAYNIESFYTAYTDTGIVGIYLGTDKGTVDRSLKLVHKELKALREVKLGVVQLRKAKQQLLGQIALAQESFSGTMIAAGRSMLHFGKIESFEELTGKVESITSESLLQVANEIYDPGNLSTLIYRAR